LILVCPGTGKLKAPAGYCASRVAGVRRREISHLQITVISSMFVLKVGSAFNSFSSDRATFNAAVSVRGFTRRQQCRCNGIFG
jgi:hypothetical protein